MYIAPDRLSSWVLILAGVVLVLALVLLAKP